MKVTISRQAAAVQPLPPMLPDDPDPSAAVWRNYYALARHLADGGTWPPTVPLEVRGLIRLDPLGWVNLVSQFKTIMAQGG